jgi:phosphoglycerate kinase
MEVTGIRGIDALDATGRTVFMRVDFNVPMQEGAVTDDARIVAALPTLRRLREQGARLVLASHLGRPKGGPDPAYSLLPVGRHLAGLLQDDVVFSAQCVGDGVQKAISDLPPGGVLLLENLRFEPGEEKADPALAAALASLADVYVNDAFGAAHRAHASTYTMVQHFGEGRKFAGLLVQRELEALGTLLGTPEPPFIGILGGAKVSDKIRIIENLLGRLDTLIIGGAMAYTFLRAQGHRTGRSLVEEDRVELAAHLLKSAASRRTQVLLPVDHIVSTSIDGEAEVCATIDMPDTVAGFDIGPATVALFRSAIARAATVIWNGPAGVFEKPQFAAGTMAVANALADHRHARVVVGGGDSAAALAMSGRVRDVYHVSTGGGASLEFLEGRELPGIAALRSGHRFETVRGES